jgi:hypothetical protein
MGAWKEREGKGSGRGDERQSGLCLKIVVGQEIPLLALDGFWSGLRGYLNENCVCVCLGQETDKKSIGLEIFCIKYMASSKSSVWRKNSANHNFFLNCRHKNLSRHTPHS